jgi:hypothetical protein
MSRGGHALLPHRAFPPLGDVCCSRDGGEVVECFVSGPQGAVGFDEVQALRMADGPILVSVQVRDQTVMEGVHGEANAPLHQSPRV